jgi:hypothetical protein
MNIYYKKGNNMSRINLRQLIREEVRNVLKEKQQTNEFLGGLFGGPSLKKGDMVILTTPGGDVKFEIVDTRRIKALDNRSTNDQIKPGTFWALDSMTKWQIGKDASLRGLSDGTGSFGLRIKNIQLLKKGENVPTEVKSLDFKNVK